MNLVGRKSFTSNASAFPSDYGNYGNLKQIVVKSSGAINILARRSGRKPFYKTPTAQVATVDVWVHYDNESPLAARFVGTFLPNTKVRIPNNGVTDKNLIVRVITRSASGVPNVSTLSDALALKMSQNREDQTPVIGLRSSATNTLIELTVSGFTQFAVARQVTTADDAGFTINDQSKEFDLTNVGNKTYQAVTRIADPSARTVYIKLRHSSTGVSGPWGAYSNVLTVAWTDTGGAGGSTGGSGDPPDKLPAMGVT